jgi:hypothetical protein
MMGLADEPTAAGPVVYVSDGRDERAFVCRVEALFETLLDRFRGSG